MKTFVKEMEMSTTREMEFFDITEKVASVVRASGMQNGVVTVFTCHTTTAVLINEKEEGLQKDMALFLNRLAPATQNYQHDREPLDGRFNTHSHLQSLLLPTSQMIPLAKGKMRLGSWQTIFFLELDGPRPKRTFTVQILGAA